MLDIPPAKVHQRVPVVMGSAEDVDECQKYYQIGPAIKRAGCMTYPDAVAKVLEAKGVDPAVAD